MEDRRDSLAALSFRELRGRGLAAISIACAIALGSAPSASAAQTITVADYPDFSDTDGLTLTGEVSTSPSGSIILTEEEAQASSAITDATVDPEHSFKARFKIQITPSDLSLGDGMTFVIANAGSSRLGDEGSGLGYGGIEDSFAVEFDTFSGDNDPQGQHVAFLRDGDVANHLTSKTIDGGLDGAPRTGWLEYNAKSTLVELYLAKGNKKKPKKPLLRKKLDLGEIINGQAVFGFTAGTGQFFSTQEALSLNMTEKLPAGTIRYPDFTDNSGFKLNGSARPIMDSFIRLTDDEPDVAGGFFTKEAFLPTDRSFSAAFSFQIVSSEMDPADGLAFVLQAGDAKALGRGDSGLGYEGVKKSVAVAFKTFNERYLQLGKNGNLETALLLALDPVGTQRYVWIDYDALATESSIYYSDSPVKPAEPITSFTFDLTKLGKRVRVGFTGATGALSSAQDILSLNVDSFRAP